MSVRSKKKLITSSATFLVLKIQDFEFFNIKLSIV